MRRTSSWFASDANCTGLHLVRLRCWSHGTCSGFASDANCTGLALGSPRMLIAQDLILLCLSGLTTDCQFFTFSFIFHLDLSSIASSSHHFFIIFFTYLDLPLSASLIVLWLYHSCLLDWTYTSDANLVEIWSSLKILIQWNLSSSSPKVFLKLLSGAGPFFILHLYFR